MANEKKNRGVIIARVQETRPEKRVRKRTSKRVKERERKGDGAIKTLFNF